MRFICISDTHMSHRGFNLPHGDVLIHAGDATSTGTPDEVDRFLRWFAAQAHPHKILIAGNHDWIYQKDPERAASLLAKYPEITYLQDSGVTIDGVRFWGSPWQPWFMDWAFNLPRNGEKLREVWGLIPEGTDVLITHGPPHGVLDQVHGGEHLGCEQLKLRLGVVRPKVHIFGHIHDGFGVVQSRTTTYINACTCTEQYRALNRPIVFDLKEGRAAVHGVEANPRKEWLENLRGLAEANGDEHKQTLEVQLSEVHLRALSEMAEHRGMTLEVLLEHYALRGLHADVAKYSRVEGKSRNRSIPFKVIEDEG
ncbi:MAG: metallophosphatase domain-containing protein [Holophagaceae bacterium]